MKINGKNFLSVEEISSILTVHSNTVRNKCLSENPDETSIRQDGRKKLIEVLYACERIGKDPKKYFLDDYLERQNKLKSFESNEEINFTKLNKSNVKISEKPHLEKILTSQNLTNSNLESLEKMIETLRVELSEKNKQLSSQGALIEKLVASESETKKLVQNQQLLQKQLQEKMDQILTLTAPILEEQQKQKRKKFLGIF